MLIGYLQRIWFQNRCKAVSLAVIVVLKLLYLQLNVVSRIAVESSFVFCL